MVFFTCNLCGESVKKASVEKHYNTKCRGADKNVSCMDCLKDFHGEDYVQHIKCITEAEKYSGKGYVAKESKNSGENKQIAWTSAVHSILDSTEHNLSPAVRKGFEKLQNYNNVPRKKAKFENFIQNCMRESKSVAQSIWQILEKELEKMKAAKAAEMSSQSAEKEATSPKANSDTKTVQNGHNGVEEEKENENNKSMNNDNESSKSSSNKKRKSNETVKSNEALEAPLKKKKKSEVNNITEETANKSNGIVAATANTEQFQWAVTLEKIAAKHNDGIIIDILKKKLQKKYLKYLGDYKPTDKDLKQFEKKFKKYMNRSKVLKVEDNIVKCC